MKLISVIVPVYNVEAYVSKCIQSLIDQTYKNIEIILINDGSTDESKNICSNFAEHFSNVNLFNTVNQGQSAARNIGLKHAKGEYIGFVDSDDYIEHDFYESLINAIESTDSSVASGLIVTDQINQNLTVINREEAITRIMGGDLGTVVWNKLFRADILKDVYFPIGQVHEEIEFNRNYLTRVAKLVVVPNVKYHYTSKRDGNTNSRFELSRLNVFDQINKFISDVSMEGQANAKRALIIFGAIQFLDMYKSAYRNSADKTIKLKIRRCFMYYFKHFDVLIIRKNPVFTLRCCRFLIAPDTYIRRQINGE